MRINQLDAVTMGELMADLCAAYGKPFGAAAQEQVRVYHSALADFDAGEVRAAVQQACKTLERMPHPAKLRAMCYAARPKRNVIHHEDPSDTCRECGSVYQWRRLPHWAHAKMGLNAAHDLQCDCGWRLIVHGYATEEDLAEMGDDPFALNEARRRGASPRRAA